MFIGIVVSTELEAGILLKNLASRKKTSVQGKAFHSGSIGSDVRAAVCICGIGKTNAAHGTTLLLAKFKPDIIYSIGVAGAYPSSGLMPGDIAAAEKEIYGDEGLTLKKGFHTMDALKLPVISGGAEYYNEFPLFVPERLKGFKFKGNFITVSSCTGTLDKGLEMETRFGAICENMEGAAVAHICALNGIPLTEIRGISNIIEDRSAAPIDRADIIKAAENVQKFFLERLV